MFFVLPTFNFNRKYKFVTTHDEYA